MPELPEVEVIRRELVPQLVGQIVDDVEIHWSKSFVDQSSDKITGKTILDINRMGKYLVIVLSAGYLVVHLRMTGQLMFAGGMPENKKHIRIILRMRSGKYLIYFDSRKFGRLIHADRLNGVLKNTGIDALSPELSVIMFQQMLKNHNRMVKSFLMDQRQIAGLGNIYVDESLFRAKIHPQTITHIIPERKIYLLFESIRETLLHSIKNMGTTISDYKTVGGGFGGHQRFLQVYGRGDKPCFVCGTPIRKIRMNNRGTHFCPKCQPLRKKRQ